MVGPMRARFLPWLSRVAVLAALCAAAPGAYG